MPVASGAPSTAQVPSSAAGPAVFSRSLALRGGTLLVVSAAAAAAASSLLFAGPGTSRERIALTLTEVRAVPPAEAASFAILRRPLRSTDAVAAVHAGSGPVGANPALARTLSEPNGGLSAGAVSVVPANGWVCLRVPFAKGGAQWWCQTLALAQRGKLVMALRPAGPLRNANATASVARSWNVSSAPSRSIVELNQRCRRSVSAWSWPSSMVTETLARAKSE